MLNKDESHVFLESSNNPKGLMPSSEGDHKTFPNKKIVKLRKQLYPICYKLTMFTAVVLLTALTVLTIIREVQIKAMRDEVDFLRRDIAEFKNLVMEDGYMDDFKKFENEVTLEEEKLPTGSPIIDPEYDSDDDDYDDSILDDGTDFLGEVMEANLEDKSQFIDDIQPPIKKVMRVLKPRTEDELKYNRSRRNVIAETADGVPIIDEPYHISKAKNISQFYISPPLNLRRMPENDQNVPKMFHGWDSNNRGQAKRAHEKYDESMTSTESPGAVYTRPSRVMATNDDKSKSFRKVIRFRRPMTKSGLASDYDAANLERQSNESESESGHRRRRKYRSESRRLRNMRDNVEEIEAEKPTRSGGLLAAHFNGDTKDFRMGHHEHYDGNGRLRHPHDVPYTAWSPAPWLGPLNLDTKFALDEGSVSVPETGIYFVYAQIYYHDEHDTNGFRIFKNNGMKDEVLLQCTTMTYSTTRIEKSNTCYTAGAFYLIRGDGISIKNLGSMRYSIMEPGKSFFGLIKLGSARIK